MKPAGDPRIFVRIQQDSFLNELRAGLASLLGTARRRLHFNMGSRRFRSALFPSRFQVSVRGDVAGLFDRAVRALEQCSDQQRIARIGHGV